jgi:hypothetical protein
MSDPFKEALRKMNTCSTCPNDLVCHDQGECLRPTPETDAALPARWGVSSDFARRLERERDEAREEAARLQMELDASCNAEELRQVREENARLREALTRITAIENRYNGGDWDEIEEAREIAQHALTP